MSYWWLLGGILFTIYGFFILLYTYWLYQLPRFSYSGLPFGTSFTIIIPARNEEQSIHHCLQSITQQNYPAHLYTIVVINDHSTDGTAAVVEEWKKKFSNIKLIHLHDVVQDLPINSYKKLAVAHAVKNAETDWIIATDADCTFSPNWLATFHAFITAKEPVFVAAPVQFVTHNTVLGIFQQLDFLSLQGITAASVGAGFHSMCNGANIGYSKNAFETVEGFKGVDHIASGDDMLLMHKIKHAFPGKVQYLYHPDAVVSTQPMFSWKSFFNQRIRWASKADQYQDKSIMAVLIVVYLFNVWLFFTACCSVFNSSFLLAFGTLLLAKTLVEIIFMQRIAQFFGAVKALWWFPLMQPLHIIYTLIAGWLGKFGTYQWKGRQVK
ncbi:MAG: glycosyltransferase [Bacteroidetes bacterium]|nr:MAG: glycosyltransferase [Bacteroidota bacterium]TAE69866.1 MAG: glycosyltransferase [Bacteroidota bacterium]TAF92569.1 MAG: glycosyltransferase [Bacteroidota bacterium]